MERTQRVEEEIKKIVGNVIDKELKDPRLSGGLVSVTAVSISKDLRYCKIFVSMIGIKDVDAALEALKSSAGYIRREIGNGVRMYYTPEVRFMLDTSMEYGAHMESLINELGIKPDDKN